MDPTTVCCPHRPCPARGQTGQSHMGIHARQEQRGICHACDTTCSATRGTVFYRLRPSAETVRMVVPGRAQGGPVQAMVAAGGCDERTIAAWWARAGRQGQAGHAYRGAPPRALGQVQADARRVQKQGGIVWMAMAMMVQPRLGRGRQCAARPASEPAAAQAGPPLCGAPAAGGLSRWLGGLSPSQA